ncbi:MAG: pirin family protein [Thermoleophilia bacterium]
MAREIKSIFGSALGREGGGFPIRRPFPTGSLEQADPFLLLDEMGPVEWGPGEAVGAPDHPHYGFETVTYLLAGEMEHRDSSGRAGRLGPGDVQWMTAGGGVIHSEEPSSAFRLRGGLMHGFQLWVNLPQEYRRVAPRYQELPAEKIPEFSDVKQGVRARIIAGAAFGIQAAVETYVPITYVHLELQPHSHTEVEIPADQEAYAYVFRGTGAFGPAEVLAGEGDFVLFSRDGDSVRVAAAHADEGETPPSEGMPLEVLLLGGRALNEPLARQGPFVAGSEDELREVFEAYRSGRFPPT